MVAFHYILNGLLILVNAPCLCFERAAFICTFVFAHDKPENKAPYDKMSVSVRSYLWISPRLMRRASQSSDPNRANEGESIWINIRNNYS